MVYFVSNSNNVILSPAVYEILIFEHAHFKKFSRGNSVKIHNSSVHVLSQILRANLTELIRPPT